MRQVAADPAHGLDVVEAVGRVSSSPVATAKMFGSNTMSSGRMPTPSVSSL